MGIRFACHHCNYAMNLKDFQAGKRGKCPSCQNTFRIPDADAPFSIPLDESRANAQLQLATKKPVANEVPLAIPKPERPTSPAAVMTAAPPTVERHTSTKVQPPAVGPLDANPTALWYVRPPSGGQYGPADSAALKEWIRENRVTSDSLLWHEGQTQWLSASEIAPELFSLNANDTKSPVVSADLSTAPPSAIASPQDLIAALELESPLKAASTIVVAGKPVQRRMKHKRNQLVVIAVLASLCLCLLIGLIAVLVLQR